MNNINNRDNVLIIWSSSNQDDLPNFVNQVKDIAKNGEVVLENSERLLICKYTVYV